MILSVVVAMVVANKETCVYHFYEHLKDCIYKDDLIPTQR